MLSLPILEPPSPTPCCSSPSSPLLKKKRPAKLDIPIGSLTFGVPAAAAVSPATRDVVEVEGSGFSVYCKRGMRRHMEDRFSAAVDLQGEPTQVIKKKRFFSFGNFSIIGIIVCV